MCYCSNKSQWFLKSLASRKLWLWTEYCMFWIHQSFSSLLHAKSQNVCVSCTTELVESFPPPPPHLLLLVTGGGQEPSQNYCWSVLICVSSTTCFINMPAPFLSADIVLQWLHKEMLIIFMGGRSVTKPWQNEQVIASKKSVICLIILNLVMLFYLWFTLFIGLPATKNAWGNILCVWLIIF